MAIYEIKTDNFGDAIASLVAAFRLQSPGIGVYRATYDDGTKFTLWVPKPKAPKAKTPKRG